MLQSSNSNLANMEATVKAGEILEFLSLTTQWYHMCNNRFKFHKVV